MKISIILSSLVVFTTAVNAKGLLAVFEDEVTIGQSYKVEWLQNTAKEVLLLLVTGSVLYQ